MREAPSFSWSNYFKPTPKNLEKFMILIKVILAGIAGTALLNQHPYLSSYILLSAGILDHLAKFFAEINDDYVKTITTTITGPAEATSQIEVKTETSTEPQQ